MDKNKYIEVAVGFDEHLKDNDNILFSGIYGIGKTTYLRQYFKENANYLAFHLFPVNYAVSDNSDIFELIKADLLYILLDYIDVDVLTQNESIYKSPLAGYLSENYDKIFLSIAKRISKTGNLIVGIIEELQTLRDGFEKHENDLNKSTKEYQVSTFFNSMDVLKGSPYESDAITLLIEELITLVKLKHQDKKLVFIIDDLDRIDPAHVFRILNIFSAHFDGESKNKFSFDKVIIVADYDNLKGIYHHFYGSRSSFNGYIDKFVSNTVYRITFTSTPFRHFIDKLNSQVDSYHEMKGFVSRIIEILFINGCFNFRQQDLLETNNFDFHNLPLPASQFLNLILYLYDYDTADLINKLKVCNNTSNGFKSDFRNQKEFYMNIIFRSLYQLRPELFKSSTGLNDSKIQIVVDAKKFNLIIVNSWNSFVELELVPEIEPKEFIGLLVYYYKNTTSNKNFQEIYI